MGTTKQHTETGARVIQLDVTNVDGRVVVTPSDGDRFPIRVDEAIEACLRHKADELTQKRFILLLGRLGTWAREHTAQVRDAFVTLRDGGVCFLVVHSTPKYDEAFEDALTVLDRELARDQDFLLFRVEVVSIPPVSEKSLRSFLSPDLQLRFGGKRK